ncbi:hypothetical protein MAR_037687 [Mya arenaria]|uniref:Uncharacterized protein n=1 Tax=Mya arenaria TaxID=6604 RepID=A0ABY7FP63_MYAAR|nr:hypothetical protein MAR_037687 [Mya arenaria]
MFAAHKKLKQIIDIFSPTCNANKSPPRINNQFIQGTRHVCRCVTRPPQSSKKKKKSIIPDMKTRVVANTHAR